MIELYKNSLKIGIVAHSYEGGSLCFLTACREGASLIGPHMHPNILLSAIPMGLSMESWESGSYSDIEKHLLEGIHQVALGGADFFICPDNTAHIVLENIISEVPIPGLHISHVVCHKIKKLGSNRVGLLGTKWTMNASVYSNALEKYNLVKIVPDELAQKKINDSIFEELCQGEFKRDTINFYLDTIEDLKKQGAECVILGCTEIPLIVNPENSPIPVLDSTRLLAKYAVKIAIKGRILNNKEWINPSIIEND